jgi:hypothetical protein
MYSLPLLLLLAAEPIVPAEPVVPGRGWFKPAEVEKGCVARSIVMPPGVTGTGKVNVKFAVWTDGTPDRVEVTEVVPPLVAEAITAAVKGCRFTPGRKPDGARAAVWTSLPLRFVDESGAAGHEAPEGTPGQAPPPVGGGTPPSPGTPPRQAEPGCVEKQLHYRFPPNRMLRGLLVIRVAMSAEGTPGAFEFPPDLPPDVANAFKLSVQACPFQPATTPAGLATAGTYEYRVNFALPGEAEREAGAGPRLKREAKLASTACLQRLRPFGVIGHAVVQVRVTEGGEPTNFRLQPDNVPADLQLHIIDVLGTCKWQPAVGLDDKPIAADTVVTIRYK